MSAANHLLDAIAYGCTRDDHDHIADHRDEVLREVGWEPCSPEWLAAHPGQCDSAPRVPGGHDSHWHPQTVATQANGGAIALERQARILRDIERCGGRWTSGRAVPLYHQLGYVGGVRTARFDLEVLRAAGHLVRHDEQGVRYYTLAKGGGAR